MRSRGAIPAATIALVLLLGGCGGDEPGPSAEPSATPSPSPTVPPGLDTAPPEEPEQEPTAASAEEFGRYFALLVQHAIRVRDIEPVISLARDQAACSVCGEVGDFIEEMKKDGVWEVGPDLRIRVMQARPRGEQSFDVIGGFAYPSAKRVRLDGTVDGNREGGQNYVFRADLTWNQSQGGWQVGDFTFLDKDETDE